MEIAKKEFHRQMKKWFTEYEIILSTDRRIVARIGDRRIVMDISLGWQYSTDCHEIPSYCISLSDAIARSLMST